MSIELVHNVIHRNEKDPAKKKERNEAGGILELGVLLGLRCCSAVMMRTSVVSNCGR